MKGRLVAMRRLLAGVDCAVSLCVAAVRKDSLRQLLEGTGSAAWPPKETTWACAQIPGKDSVRSLGWAAHVVEPCSCTSCYPACESEVVANKERCL